MPIYDYDGTTLHEIGKIYDFNGTTSQQINKVYDSTGGVNSLIYSCGDFINNGVSYIGSPITATIQGNPTFTYTAYVGNYVQYQTVASSNPTLWIKYPNPIDVADISKITVTYDSPKSSWNMWFTSCVVNSSGGVLAQTVGEHLQISTGAFGKTSYVIDCSSLTDNAAYLWQKWQISQFSGTQTTQLRLYSVIGE